MKSKMGSTSENQIDLIGSGDYITPICSGKKFFYF